VKVVSVVGARPNFVKIAPLMRAMARRPALSPLLVHTGQHYDAAMSQQFFDDLDIPAPDAVLEVGSASHAVQTAEVMRRLEPVLQSLEPDLVLVVGDVNSTMAAALTAVKLGLRVAHVEAGLRSRDRSMPEEINRLVTDAVSDVLFVTEESGRRNLIREGVDAAKIHLVGNVMIDALDASRARWERSDILARLGLDRGLYAVVTLHRPSNVDDPVALSGLLDALHEVARQIPIVFPVHPRVRRLLARTVTPDAAAPDAAPGGKGLVWLEALGYLEFIALISRARFVLTDSGGVQEETTALGIPCLTLRDSTERPATVTHGTNRVIGARPDRIVDEALRSIEHAEAGSRRPPLWDGHSAERIAAVLERSARGA
jgi:UDP-N-acetylglucosamine 2-epimerase (non-hydrolysing)